MFRPRLQQLHHHLLAASGCCRGGTRGGGGGSGSRLPDNEQREKETLIKKTAAVCDFFLQYCTMRFSSFYSGCNFLQGPDRLSEQGAELKVGARALNDVIPAVARCDPPPLRKPNSSVSVPKTTRVEHDKTQGRSKINRFQTKLLDRGKNEINA